jgi:hypothetical protein
MAMVSWVLAGNVVWILAGTTSFFSLILFTVYWCGRKGCGIVVVLMLAMPIGE